jgi:mannose-6-phosphate isomerase-like protein (cupin superfamily)
MNDFPDFMKNPMNRIAATSEHTREIEGYVFDGADGSQLAFWTCASDAETKEHVHPFDEWFLVIEGAYVVVLDGRELRIEAGEEYVIPKGTRIAGRVVAGTRTIHAFGGRRAERAKG